MVDHAWPKPFAIADWGLLVASQFFPDSLIDQYVRVDRHAECQRNGGNTGQSKRDLHKRQYGNQQQNIH